MGGELTEQDSTTDRSSMTTAPSQAPSSWISILVAIGITGGGLVALSLGFDDWAEQQLPIRLQRLGPGGIALWRWLLLPLVLSVVWSLGYLLSRLTRGLLSWMARRTRTPWDEQIVARIGAPLTLAWMLGPTLLLLPWLGLAHAPLTMAQRLLGTGLLFSLFWGVLRSLDVVAQAIMQSTWAKAHPSTHALLPLVARIAKVLLMALGSVALLSELGYPVASLIAGLGIGGLAVALAAQKTVENLFGAFSIGADQPFREGDFVRVEDFVGTVEAIGLRSTKIRTLDRTLITIPNGKLAEMRLESYSVRDRMRLACNVGLVYATSPAQLREILARLERVLREHPKIWPDSVVVRFKELGDSALIIEVMAWFQTCDWAEFQLIRQDILLQFMEVVDGAGSSFAFPTRTVHLIQEGADPMRPPSHGTDATLAGAIKD